MQKHVSRSLIGAAAVAALLLTGCSSGGAGAQGGGAKKLDVDLSKLASTTEPGSAPVDSINWNLPFEPSSLDPMLTANYGGMTVDANLCDGLMRQNPDLTISPGLAEKVEMPNDTTYVYTLRDGAKFWDGTPVTPADVVFSLTRQGGSPSASYFAEYFTKLQSVEATGAHEVTVRLSAPDALFGKAMSVTGPGSIVSKAFAEQAGKAFGTPKGGLMCSGPFKLGEWTPGKSVEILKNDAYWDEKLVPKVGKVNFSFISDESTAVNALRSGDIDGQYFFLPPAGLGQLQGDAKVTTTFGKSYVFFTLAGAAQQGPFAEPKVREALLSLVDRQAISDVVFQGAATPSRTLAGEAYFDSSKQADEYGAAWKSFGVKPDVKRAKQLLAEAGVGAKPITVAVQGSSAVHEQVGNLLKAAGDAAGLKIEIKVVPVEQYLNLYVDPKAREGIDAFLTSWHGYVADPLDVYQVFGKGLPNNYSNYAGVADQVDRARGTVDDAARAKATIELQQKVTEEAPWLPLTDLPTILVQNKRISGATASFAYTSYPWAATIGGTK